LPPENNVSSLGALYGGMKIVAFSFLSFPAESLKISVSVSILQKDRNRVNIPWNTILSGYLIGY